MITIDDLKVYATHQIGVGVQVLEIISFNKLSGEIICEIVTEKSDRLILPITLTISIAKDN